jgi:hypothetical protein
MLLGNRKLKVVVLDQPVFTLDDPFCATILGQALKMKRDSYSMSYHDDILPMDKSDFFGTHIILCEEINNQYTPIFAYKSVTLDRCLQYNFEFPIYTIMKTDCHEKCKVDIQNIIDIAGDSSSVSYDSHLAKNLDYRLNGDADLKNAIQEIIMMVIVKHHEEFKIPHMINLGVVKVQTDKFFLRLGQTKINEYADLKLTCLNNEDCVLFYSNSFSIEANQMAWKYKKLWDNKLVVDGLRAKRNFRRAA